MNRRIRGVREVKKVFPGKWWLHWDLKEEWEWSQPSTGGKWERSREAGHAETRSWAVDMLEVLDLKCQPRKISRKLDTLFRRGDRPLWLVGIYAVIEVLSIKEPTWKEEEAWTGALRNCKSEWPVGGRASWEGSRGRVAKDVGAALCYWQEAPNGLLNSPGSGQRVWLTQQPVRPAHACPRARFLFVQLSITWSHLPPQRAESEFQFDL